MQNFPMKNICLCLLLVGFSGCASYSNSFQRVEFLLSQQQPEEALVEVEKRANSSSDKLLYLMDKAMLQRMSGQYEASNTTFEAAKKLGDKLTATSILEQAGAITLNDSIMSYEGEDFERVAVHMYSALNYIALNQWDEARVEALQADFLLQKLREDADKDTVFAEDAFARYLMGMIYEHGQEWSDAMISYRKALLSYQTRNKSEVPTFLKYDVLRMATRLGLIDEVSRYKQEFGISPSTSDLSMRDKGEVIVLLHHSLSPIKRDENVFVLGDDGIEHRIAFPVFESRSSPMAYAQLVIGDERINLDKVNDFDVAARESLETHKPAMMARLLARAIVKHNMAEAMRKESGELAGFMMNMAAMATETADTRSWLTLPKDIYLARVALPEGKYPASLQLFGANEMPLAIWPLPEVEVVRGGKYVFEKIWVKSPLPAVVTKPQ